MDTHGQLILGTFWRYFRGERIIFSTDGAGIIGYPFCLCGRPNNGYPTILVSSPYKL